MPLARPVCSLVTLCISSLERHLVTLAGLNSDRSDATLTRIISVCRVLTDHLPSCLVSPLADSVVHEWSTSDSSSASAPTSSFLAAIVCFLLGGRLLSLSVNDLLELAGVLLSTPLASTVVGPVKLSVMATMSAWLQQQQQNDIPGHLFDSAFDLTLQTFSRLTHLTLIRCATNTVLHAVGRWCCHLESLRVDVALVDDEGVRRLLGAACRLDELVLLCQQRRPPPVAANDQRLTQLRHVRLEATLVSARGLLCLLVCAPQLRVCHVSDVDINDALCQLSNDDAGEHGDAAAVRQFCLERLEYRQPMDVAAADTVLRWCRQLRRVCVRGRRSARNDTALLNRFVGNCGQLCSVELIDMHPAAVLSMTAALSDRLLQLRLVETISQADAARLTCRTLSDIVGQCQRLDTLSLSLAADPPGGSTVVVGRHATAQSVRRVGLDGVWGPALIGWLCTSGAPLCDSLRLSAHAGGLADGDSVQCLLTVPLTRLRRLEMASSGLSTSAALALVTMCPLLEHIGQLPPLAAAALNQLAKQHNWQLHVT